MNFTEIFIRRPVLATVVSLMIMLMGLQAIFTLPVRQYPAMENTQITVTTSYPGAGAELVQGFITTPIQQAVASASGIDYITSVSQLGLSTITLQMKLGVQSETALADVLAKVQQTLNVLPSDAQQPVIQKAEGGGSAQLYLGFSSKDMTGEQITDYLTRVVQPALQTIDGVASASILGGETYAMRIWLDPNRMASLGVTSGAVSQAIQNNNLLSAPGQVKGNYIQINIEAQTDLRSVQGFEELVVAVKDGTLIRLKDVAEIELDSQSNDSSVIFNGLRATFIGITNTPEANPLQVIDLVRAALPGIEEDLPPSLNMNIAYDATTFIRASIEEVVKTILEAAVIVIIVMFLFLGSFRAVIIPIVTIPLSLVGVCFMMLALGYSLNLLTLLAMVLAIGLVVDDAIVVVENIFRHLEEGLSPLQAAITGAAEIAVPVIVMTITLAAVYAPIGFVGGLTGALFQEFAFTLAGAVIVSGIIALTLSPMMSSLMLNESVVHSRLVNIVNKVFDGLRRFYERRLVGVLLFRPVMLLLTAGVLAMLPYLFLNTLSELAPTEDQGIVFMQMTSPQSANIDYMEAYSEQMGKIFKGVPQADTYFQINGSNGVNQGIAGMLLKPWGERDKSQQQIRLEIQPQLSEVAGLQIFAFDLPPLPGSGNFGIQFVIQTTNDYNSLYKVMEDMKVAAYQSGLFVFISNDLEINNPQVILKIDRAKAADIGLNMVDIGGGLSTLLGGNYINYFSLEARSYQVIPQVPRIDRLTPEDLTSYYVQAADGSMVPLSTVVSLDYDVIPNARTQFQQLNSATLSGIMMPGRSIGEGLAFLEAKSKEIFPSGFSYNFAGESRQFVQEGSSLTIAFAFALVVIFLVLAAKFESWRDPIIILITVPLSMLGALLPLFMGLATINIYTQVGMVTLVGLISKHGILMVEFANQLQAEEGLDKRHAIVKAAGIRLRPVLMTTAAMVVGVIPLIIASGAGAKSRSDIGLVIACGMTIGTLFTLFVVPVIYTFLAGDHRHAHGDGTEGDGTEGDGTKGDGTHGEPPVGGAHEDGSPAPPPPHGSGPQGAMA